MKGVILLAHGTPDSLEDLPEYLTRVRGGRPPSRELVDEMFRNYSAIGGRSPLTQITRAQAEALSRELGGTPVHFGMRNSAPFIAEALSRAAEEGVTEIVALPLAPQYSALSVGRYREAVEQGAPRGLSLRFVSAWHQEPLLLDAFCEKLLLALEGGAPDAVVFTAHSLPLRVTQEGDPYVEQVAATAAGVASRAGLEGYRLAYQSAGRTGEKWLGPSLEEALAEAADAGARRALVVPVGFVSDHTEILFDIDIQAKDFARERGMDLSRTESLNTSPTFIRALAHVVSDPRG